MWIAQHKTHQSSPSSCLLTWKQAPSIDARLITQAISSLNSHPNEIDLLSDLAGPQGSYHEACCIVLVHELDVDRDVAVELMRAISAESAFRTREICQARVEVTTRKETQVTKTLTGDDLLDGTIETITEAYITFCRENNIIPASAPTEKKNDIIYWFTDMTGERRFMSYQRVYELLYMNTPIPDYINQTVT